MARSLEGNKEKYGCHSRGTLIGNRSTEGIAKGGTVIMRIGYPSGKRCFFCDLVLYARPTTPKKDSI